MFVVQESVGCLASLALKLFTKLPKAVFGKVKICFVVFFKVDQNKNNITLLRLRDRIKMLN